MMNLTIFRCFSKKTFSAKNLDVKLQTILKPNFQDQQLEFGHINTAHMAEIKYNKNDGWSHPRIIPFQNIPIHPFNSTLHYSLSAFEGLKAYRNENGLRLFRPMENMNRFLESAKRLAFPTFDPNELLKIVEEFVKIEKDWIPTASGSSLYIRPLMISLTNQLGVHAASETAIYIMASPVSSYFKKKGNETPKINLKVNEDYWRGSPHSCAGYKLSCNYAPTVSITNELQKHNFSQAIWTFNENLLESGASNLFFIKKNNSGSGYELITHPLDNSILPGVTRSTILRLANKAVPELTVSERAYNFKEFIEDYNNKQLIEVFASGTAVVIGPVDTINLRNKDYSFSYDDNAICKKLRKFINDIQEGRVQHEFSHLIKE